MLRYLVIGLCVSGLLLGAVKNPRRDANRPLPSSAMQAEAAWQEGRALHDKALASMSDLAAEPAGKKDKRRKKARRELDVALSRYAKALRHLDNAGAAPAYLHELHTRRGDALAQTDRPDEALAAYADALRIRPDSLQAIYGQARAELALGQTDRVRESYTRLLEAAEVYGEAWIYVDWLIASMRAWASTQRLDSGGIDTGSVDAFASWVDEQSVFAAAAVRWSLMRSD